MKIVFEPNKVYRYQNWGDKDTVDEVLFIEEKLVLIVEDWCTQCLGYVPWRPGSPFQTLKVSALFLSKEDHLLFRLRWL